MDRLYIILAILFICILGLVRVIIRINRIIDMRSFAQSYFGKLKEYISSGGRDSESYSWLTQKSTVMQRQLGRSGIMAAYRPPFANFQYQNYPILLNMLPDLRNSLADSYALGRLADQYGATLQEVMIRHIGEVDEIETDQRKLLKNPFIWLREGIRALLSSPIYLLQWFGLISETATDRVVGNFIFRFISSFVVLVGFIGSVISIVVGWDQFVGILRNVLKSPYMVWLKPLVERIL